MRQLVKIELVCSLSIKVLCSLLVARNLSGPLRTAQDTDLISFVALCACMFPSTFKWMRCCFHRYKSLSSSLPLQIRLRFNRVPLQASAAALFSHVVHFFLAQI